jgi:quinoprotein glucose dehydrogenase
MMNVKRAVAMLLAACAFAGVATSTSAQGSPTSVWDGVYTDSQADRGKAQYLQNCASCHSETLQGVDEAPGLVGEGFLASWVDLPAADLFERIRISMPQDRPGQLSRAAYADILAYLFRVNKFPAGNTELASDLAALKQIVIAARRQ